MPVSTEARTHFYNQMENNPNCAIHVRHVAKAQYSDEKQNPKKEIHSLIIRGCLLQLPHHVEFPYVGG